MILARGQDKVGQPGGDGIPCGVDSTEGHIVMVLGVDGDHDEVHYSRGDHTRTAAHLLHETLSVLQAAVRGTEQVARS